MRAQSVPESIEVGLRALRWRTEFPREEVRAILPRCSWQGCARIGTKWISRACCNCDAHSSEYLQDTPWAAFVRKEGL